MKRSLAWLCVAFAISSLGACASGDGGADKPPLAAAAETTLTAFTWQLQNATDSKGAAQAQWVRDGAAGKPAVFTFKDQRLSVTGLCNTLLAGYDIQGQQMDVSQVVSTMRACADASLMRYEQDVAGRLAQVSAWRIDGSAVQAGESPPVLTLRFQDGGQWQLQGTPTPETLYGTAGETLFLEVAAQEIPCHHPLMPNAPCLNVRTVQYDAAGLKQDFGAWQAFYENIEGYTHQAGTRNVLRVKRYTRKDVPADASRYAYVLDMVVESER